MALTEILYRSPAYLVYGLAYDSELFDYVAYEQLVGALHGSTIHPVIHGGGPCLALSSFSLVVAAGQVLEIPQLPSPAPGVANELQAAASIWRGLLAEHVDAELVEIEYPITAPCWNLLSSTYYMTKGRLDDAPIQRF